MIVYPLYDTGMLEVTNKMAAGKFRPKVRELLDRYDKTLYQASKDGDVAYSTIHRWLNDSGNIERVEGKALYSFLMGLGLTLDEVNELRLGEVFEFTPEGTEEQTKD